MRFELVSTRNVRRILDALTALEKRLTDAEVAGMGLVYGRPGLGKPVTVTKYHATSSAEGRIRTVFVRALAHWNESGLLRGLLEALGHYPKSNRKDAMFDRIIDELNQKQAIFLIDEVDSLASSRQMIAILKDIHDLSRSAFLLIGEDRVDGILRRYGSFYNRIHRSTLAQLEDHSAGDVHAVIKVRCEIAVDTGVCSEIHKLTGGKSMRSVLDQVRDMEWYAKTNGLKRITIEDFRRMNSGFKPLKTLRPNPRLAEAINA
jgi:Cdc6-like AAA superfamily ATPase